MEEIEPRDESQALDPMGISEIIPDGIAGDEEAEHFLAPEEFD